MNNEENILAMLKYFHPTPPFSMKNATSTVLKLCVFHLIEDFPIQGTLWEHSVSYNTSNSNIVNSIGDRTFSAEDWILTALLNEKRHKCSTKNKSVSFDGSFSNSGV